MSVTDTKDGVVDRSRELGVLPGSEERIGSR